MIGVFDVRSFAFNVLSVLNVVKKKKKKKCTETLSSSCCRMTVMPGHVFNVNPVISAVLPFKNVSQRMKNENKRFHFCLTRVSFQTN